MKKRRQELWRIVFCGAKACISLLPLVPQCFGSFIHVIDDTLECVRYLSLVLVLMDAVAMRYLFYDDLISRKGQASLRLNTWNFPSAVLQLLAAIIVGVFIIILMGGPALSEWMETLHLSILLSIMSFWPFALLFSQPLEELLKVASFDSEMTMEKGCVVPGVLAVIGAWCSAILYPLDWDRPWQRWPIPNLFGAFGGYQLCYTALCISYCFKYLKSTTKFSSKSE